MARDSKGQFVKGQSGNPLGRAQKLPTKFDDAGFLLTGQDLFLANMDAVHDELFKLIMSKDTSPAAKVSAIKEYQERGFGKSASSLTIKRDDKGGTVDLSDLPEDVLRQVLAAAQGHLEDRSPE